MTQFWNVIINLCSGGIGAVLVLLWQLKYEKQREGKETINLAQILVKELDALKHNIESESDLRISISLNLWRDLTSEIIRLLQPNIVKEIADIYSTIDFLEYTKSSSMTGKVLLAHIKQDLKIKIDEIISNLTDVYKLDKLKPKADNH